MNFYPIIRFKKFPLSMHLSKTLGWDVKLISPIKNMKFYFLTDQNQCDISANLRKFSCAKLYKQNRYPWGKFSKQKQQFAFRCIHLRLLPYFPARKSIYVERSFYPLDTVYWQHRMFPLFVVSLLFLAR